MRKTLYSLLIGVLALGSTALIAKTGVIVYEKDGTTTFFPSENVEFIEFVDDYEEPTTPNNPGENEDPTSPDNPGENEDPSTPDNPGENEDPSTPDNPGENEDPSTPDNPGENEDPTSPDNPGENEDPSTPENPGENEDPSTPDNPGENEDPSTPENPGENEDPSTPENPGENEDPSTPDNPGENEDPSTPDNPDDKVEKNFYLYTDSYLKLDQTYLIVSNGVCATAPDMSKNYDYLGSNNVSISNNMIHGNQENGFVFETSCIVNGTTYNVPAGKFLIKDSNGRYLYLTGTYTSFNIASSPAVSGNKITDNYLFSAEKTSSNTWKIKNTKDGDTKYISYSSKYKNFAAYNSLSSNDSYPYLYILAAESEAPQETPGNNGDSENDDNNGEIDQVPDQYIYPLSYVKLPEGTPQQVKEYTSFTLNFNKDNHTPNYVAWELLDTETSGSANRNNYSYWVDSDIDGCISTDFGYSQYKYERGHMCPAADNKWNGAAMKDCMVMANMCPQLSSLNGSIWGTLEDKTRSWANKYGAVWVIAGPIYEDNDNLYVGKAQARVPSSYFKVILHNNGNNSKAIAFVFQNGSNPGDLSKYAMSVDDLEKITGFDFFSSLPDDIENQIESSYNFSSWN